MTALDQFNRQFHAHFTRDVKQRFFLGVDRDLGVLSDPSVAEQRSRVAEARDVLAVLEGMPRDGLSFDDDLDLDLARLMLQSEIHEATYRFNGRTQAEQLPSAGWDIGDGLFWLFVMDPRAPGDRLTDMTTRLEMVPDYVEALLGRLDTPVARWVAMDLESVEGLPELFATLEGWAERESWPDRPRLRVAREKAEAALAGYRARLEAMPTTNTFHMAESDARKIVSLRGIELSFEDLHGLARGYLARVGAEIEELRAKLVDRYELPAGTSTDELQAFLARRFRVKIPNGNLDVILTRYEQARADILAFIEERDLFPIPADQEIRILRTPKFMESTIPAGAMEPAPPFREGVRRSIVYLTLSEGLLDEHTELSIPCMMIHEGIPGHHLHLATAGTNRSWIRRHYDSLEQSEGWTTMLEDYMLDVGFGAEQADEMRFLQKRDTSRIGARVAIDLFFMTGERGYLDVGVNFDAPADDACAAAGALLQAVTGFAPERVETEINWNSTERGLPLAYLAGNHLMWELKRDIGEAQRGRLDGLDLDRAFHRTFLESGNMPLSYLRRVCRQRGLV